MRSWKTTLFGIVSALAGFVLFSPSYFPPWAIDAAKYIMAGGLLGLGLSGKDHNVSGTGTSKAKANTPASPADI